MVKMFTASTEEIIDADIAVSELKEQLNLDGQLLQSTIGLVACQYEFVLDGILEQIAAAFPFDVVGITTSGFGTREGVSLTGFSITVLTGDNVKFSAALSESVEKIGLADTVSGVYNELLKKCGDTPKMLFSFVPFYLKVTGDQWVSEIDKVTGGIPNFGSLAISEEQDFIHSYTLFGGNFYEDRLVLIAVTGEVDPVFLHVNVLSRNMLNNYATVTGCEDNILTTINGMPAEKYVESIGLIANGRVTELISTPFIAELLDGSILSRTVVSGDNHGGIILCGHIPVGSKLGFAIMGPEDVVESTGGLIKNNAALLKGKNALIFSCMARSWAIGVNGNAELEAVENAIGGIPYSFVYSGGEINPWRREDGKFVNLFQNATLILCAL